MSPVPPSGPSSGPSYEQLHLDAQLCFRLYAASRAFTREYSELLREAGLTYPQYLVLLVLWEDAEEREDGLTVGELGSRLRLDSGTLTPLLKRLEAAGHVVRRRDPADERRVLVGLTDAGRALREQVADVPARLGGALGLSAAEIRSLRSQLDRLLDRLDGGSEG